MDIDYDGESNPVGMKTQYIISMIEIMLGQGRGITPEARTVVTRCCNTIYRPYIDHISKLKESGAGVTCDKAAMPTLNSLYNELLRQDEPEARTMATRWARSRRLPTGPTLRQRNGSWSTTSGTSGAV